MKFYDCTTAPSPRRVRIFMAEKGLEIDAVQVDLASGGQFSAADRKINPDCVVPALRLDDGTCLSEVLAICQYLEDLQPEPTLLGRTPAERALVTMWHTKVEQLGLLGRMEKFRSSARGFRDRALAGPDNYPQIPELAKRGRRRVEACHRKLDGHLADSEFLVGDLYSIADITAQVFVDFALRGNVPIPDGADNLRRWYESVSSRPSAKA